MIYSELSSRIGNQMFRYAFTRQLSEILDDDITFNIHSINNGVRYGDNWREEISNFKIKDCVFVNMKEKEILRNFNILQRLCIFLYSIIYKVFSLKIAVFITKLFWNLSNRFGVYYLVRGYKPAKKSIFKNRYVAGCFEDERFFSDISDILKDELTPKIPAPEKNAELYEVIKNNNSVCISLRCWNIDVKNEESVKKRFVCTQEYYKSAIEYIKTVVNNPVFVVFSDNIEWAKENIKSEGVFYYEDGTDPTWEKIRLMYNCKHFIMSNSTFCWWAQYLSENENKIVVSPQNWFNQKYFTKYEMNYLNSLIGADWHTINTDDMSGDCKGAK